MWTRNSSEIKFWVSSGMVDKDIIYAYEDFSLASNEIKYIIIYRRIYASNGITVHRKLFTSGLELGQIWVHDFQ